MIRFIRRDNTGGAAVEFAMVLPVFLCAIIGTAEVGALYFASAGLKHGVNAAARNATLHPTPSDAQLKERALRASFGIERPRLGLILARGSDPDKGDYIRVTGEYEAQPLTSYVYKRSYALSETRLVWVQKPPK